MGLDWWIHALAGGALASALSATVLVAVLLLAPYAFLSDFPADIRKNAPPPNASQRRAAALGGAAFLLTLFGSMFTVVFTWGLTQSQASFIDLAVMALVVFILFTAVDTVVVDWLVVCTWRPAAMVFPGTENCSGWRDRAFHVKELLHLKVAVVLLAGSAAIGLLAWLTT